MSLLELRLALYLEYHPHVRFYQRGDVSEAFARARRLVTPLGMPYRISYDYDGNGKKRETTTEFWAKLRL